MLLQVNTPIVLFQSICLMLHLEAWSACITQPFLSQLLRIMNSHSQFFTSIFVYCFFLRILHFKYDLGIRERFVYFLLLKLKVLGGR